MSNEQLLQKVRSIKTRATAMRNLGDPESGIDLLKVALSQLHARLTELETGSSANIERRDIRKELADTYGMMGGLERRCGRLEKALECYERGNDYESQDLASTYNIGNVIVLSILVKLQNPTAEPLKGLVATMIEILEKKVEGVDASRVDEWWAWSDLGQMYLLAGEPSKAQSAYNRGLATSPAVTDVKRSAELLQELGEKLGGSELADAITKQVLALGGA
jgi:tetratricopeptide (TPR) repeat protein